MSLVQGYSSSEDDEEVPGAQVQNVSQAAVAIAALPKPSKPRGNRWIALPSLIEEKSNEAPDLDSDDDDDMIGATPAKETNVPSNLETDGASASNYKFKVASGVLGSARERFVDADDYGFDLRTTLPVGLSERAENVLPGPNNLATAELSVGSQSLATQVNKRLKAEFEKQLPSEDLAALRHPANFVQINASEIRANAQKHQAAGLTANLSTSKGVSGRSNQLTSLARAAARQRDDS